MTEQDKEIFEKYCKLEEALRIAKDALLLISIDVYVSDYATEYKACKKQAKLALEQIDEVLK